MKKTTIKLRRYAKGHTIDVRYYPSVEIMRSALKEKSVCGMYSPDPYTIYPKLKVPKRLGTVHLCADHRGIGIISHEVLHFTFDWWAKMHHGKTLDKDADQEKACWIHGDTVRLIGLWLIEIKAW